MIGRETCVSMMIEDAIPVINSVTVDLADTYRRLPIAAFNEAKE